jgi:hypothetical protein
MDAERVVIDRGTNVGRSTNDDTLVIEIAIYILVIVIIISWFSFSSGKESVDIDDLEHVVMNFYKDPDYDDFIYVWSNRKKLPSQTAKTLKCWLYGVSIAQPQFIEFAEVIHGKILTDGMRREVERIIRRSQTTPTGELLDCIWAIYFATGDTKYSNIIREVARGNIQSGIEVRAAASWSYRSVMGIRAE